MPAPTRQLPNQQNSKALPGVLSRIKPIEKPTRGIRMAIYGRSGTGKTTLACDFPKPLLFIRPPDDDGRLSVHNVKGIDDVDLLSLQDLRDLTAYAKESGKYKTVVLDNASALQELVFKHVLQVDEVPTQLGWGSASQSQWGDIGVGMKDLLREFLSIQSNVLVLAQEREFNTESSISDILAPFVNCAVSPSVAGWLGPQVDYLVQTFIREHTSYDVKKVGGKDVRVPRVENQFCLRTGPHATYSTKFRVPKGTKLPDVIVDPSYAKIAALLDG